MYIKIRNANSLDASVLAKVNNASWQSTYRGLISDETLDSLEYGKYLDKWESILSGIQKERKDFCFVAENSNNDVVGYSLCGKNSHEKYSFEAELYAIYLLKEYQGQGIGRKLFLRSMEEFQQQEINSFLLFVLTSNSKSRKFYESFYPDFTANEIITIDNRQYSDTCYGWSDIKKNDFIRCNY